MPGKHLGVAVKAFFGGARLLALWAAYALVVWSTTNVQGGSGALLLLWVILLLPCGYVT
jgi:hypothetical protein